MSEYPELPPEKANFCSMCHKELKDFEKFNYKKNNMPPLCKTHLDDLLPKREKCLSLFQNLNLS